MRQIIFQLFFTVAYTLFFSGCDRDEKDNTEFGQPVEGVATYYDFADGSGACSFDPSPNDMNVAALNAVQWSTSHWCGACADVTGPSGSVRVRIVDLCPECGHGHLDLSPQAFDQIAARELGRVDIIWQFVPCAVEGPVSYFYKDGSNQWWTAVQVRNHRLPIASFQWSSDGTTWKTLPRTEYNYFLEESGFGSGSVQVRIEAEDGQILEDTLPPVQSELAISGAAQFQ